MKLCFIDLETTALDLNCGVVQLSGIVEIDGEIKDTFNYRAKPFPGDAIDDKALEIIGFTRTEVESFPNPRVTYLSLLSVLKKYVDQYNKTDKFQFVGYNSGFDHDRLREWFKKNGDKYYGSFFFNPPIDLYNSAAVKLMRVRSSMENLKLMTVAKYFGIKVDEDKAHDALYDIEITRLLYYQLIGFESQARESIVKLTGAGFSMEIRYGETIDSLCEAIFRNGDQVFTGQSPNMWRAINIAAIRTGIIK